MTSEQFAALLDVVSMAGHQSGVITEEARTTVLDAYAQARAGGAVRVPPEADKNGPQRQCFWASGWNACRAEVLRLNHPPAAERVALAEMALGKYIHYPSHWDTVAYPTLADALCEIGCSQCRAHPPAEAATWQPIESAPKDGTSVLLLIDPQDSAHSLHDDSFVVSIGSYGVEGGAEVDPTWCFAGWSWSHDEYVRGKGTPTHWQPLPEPPRAALSGRKEERT